MKIREQLKSYLPITFAIIVIILFVLIGTLCIIGIKPFKNKDVGIGLIIYGVFAGFYTGLCIGHFIAYLFSKCIPKNPIILQVNV